VCDIQSDRGYSCKAANSRKLSEWPAFIVRRLNTLYEETTHEESERDEIPKFNSVGEYLASVEPTKAMTLSSVIDLILAEFPELESKISWNVPTINRKGNYMAGICAYKHNLTFAS